MKEALKRAQAAAQGTRPGQSRHQGWEREARQSTVVLNGDQN